MDELNSYNIKGFNFAVWFFRLVLLLFITIIVLLFVMNINETVSIKEGEIVAINPQTDYKAPFEAQLVKIYTKEGQHIRAGDTLLVIHSEAYTTQEATKKAEIDYLQKESALLKYFKKRCSKKEAAAQASVINTQKHQSDVNGLTNEIKTLDEQYALQKERLRAANERYTADSILYAKDMLSKMDYNNTKDANLMLQENIAGVKSEKQKQLTQKDMALTNFYKEQNDLLINQAGLTENEQALLQSKNELETQLLQAEANLKEIEAQLGRQYVVAADSGMVNFIFNTRQTSNIINKGDILISVVPSSMAYYAKAIVPQKDARYIKAGLDARLKLDAYYQFENGLMRGKVTYMAERKENEKFYALISLPGVNNFQLRSGYTFQGEIIIKRMPLIKFLIKKLFTKLDDQ